MRNKLVRTARVVGLLIIVASLFGLPRGRFLAPVQAQNHGRSVSKEIVGRPVAAGKFMFWLQRDGRSSHLSIYGYDADQDALFSLPGKPMLGSPLATDGATVAWVERYQGRDQRVQGFDLSTGQELTLLPSVGPRELGGIAIQNQVLFYQDVSLGHRGIYARDVTTGQDQQITPTGREPVAADNRLLWTEEVYRGQYLPPRTSLHLRHLDGRAPDAVLAVGDAPLSGYSISGDYVVWAFAPPAADRRAYLHTLSTGATTPISSGPVRFPVVNGDTVVWTTETSTAPGGPVSAAVESYRIDLGSTEALVAEAGDAISTWAIFGQSDAAYVVDNDPANGKRELFVKKARGQGARQGLGAAIVEPLLALNPNVASAQETSSAFTTCVIPADCGQIAARGYYLYDSSGSRWPINGVQFFLPQHGINGYTFRDANYDTAISAANVNTPSGIDYWLDRARDDLGIRTLRIFVDLPSSTTTYTSHAKVYDFALRANARGMRLGLSLHNSSDFAMTTARRDWIVGLINYFSQRNAKSLIAYVNADNEINNHSCGSDRQGADCFDNDPRRGYTAQSYINNANAWVADFAALFRGTGILTTVGISTEVANPDGQPAWYDFYRADDSGRRMVDSVDFISPHNYGGFAWNAWNDLRNKLGYAGPIVLEEYGYPTDPYGTTAPRSYYREGPAICSTYPFPEDPNADPNDPAQNPCVQTAPWYIEHNANAVRDTRNNFAGGVAWMLADVKNKSCSSVFDLYTGLIMTGDGYTCGGTTATNPPGVKATAHRIRHHHNLYGGLLAVPASTPAATATATATATDTPMPATATPTATATATSTLAPATATPTASSTNTAPIAPPTSTPTNTTLPTNTPTNTTLPTSTTQPTSTPTNTSQPASTPTNTAKPTSTPTPIPPAGGTASSTFQVVAAADTYVSSASVTTSYGGATSMGSDGAPTEAAYVRFNVSSYTGTIVSAKLRLYTTDGAGGATGTIRRMSNTSWSETGMTYNTRASIDGAQVGSFNNVAAGTWIEADVTSIVKAPGTYSFGISQTGTDGVDFATRESSTSSRRPQLVITTR